MTKPNEYRKTYVLSTDVPYRNATSPNKGPQAGEGMLQQGRVVWLEKDPADAGEQVPAYAEGVGVVLVTATAVQPVR